MSRSTRKHVYSLRLVQYDRQGRCWASHEYHIRAASLLAAIERAVRLFKSGEMALKGKRIEVERAAKLCTLDDEA
jgi:hypothetical protein